MLGTANSGKERRAPIAATLVNSQGQPREELPDSNRIKSRESLRLETPVRGDGERWLDLGLVQL